MPIEVQCPNGHRIVCPEQRAGQAAKCPKCGVGFRIPATSGSGSGVGNAGEPRAGQTSSGASSAASASAGEAAGPLSEEMMVFLCPNGHRLNGPSRMQGKAGQCPHCGAKFIVPVIGESEEVEEVAADEMFGQQANSVHELLGTLERQEFMDASGAQSGNGWDESQSDYHATPGMSSPHPIHPLCELMGKLWEEKQHGGIIEMHLEGGALLTPDWFDEPLSRQSHGLFAAQSADGTVTMTVVPWDKVTRVVVRNVEGLPHGMFE